MNYVIRNVTEDEIEILNREGFNWSYIDQLGYKNDILIIGDLAYFITARRAIRRSPKLLWKVDDGKHSVEDCLPEPNVMLKIYCAENSDHVGGGAATLGKDGKWYWTFDCEIAEECTYPVTHWRYL